MKRREQHTFYNYQFKHTAVKITDHPAIQSVDVAEALGIHPIIETKGTLPFISHLIPW